MTVFPLEPCCCRISADGTRTLLSGGDLTPLRSALAHYGAAVLTAGTVDDGAFVALLRRLGRLIFTAGETPVPGAPDLNVVTNAGRTTPPRSVFHTDSSYFARPPAFTALRPVRLPDRGGATAIADQATAFAGLPEAERRCLRRFRVRHTVTGVDPGPGEERSAVHPLVRRHPVGGRESLYLTTPARMELVAPVGDVPPTGLLDDLYAWATDEAYIYRHRWAPGDLLIWDNRLTLHRGEHAGVVGERRFHRGMVEGEVPIPA